MADNKHTRGEEKQGLFSRLFKKKEPEFDETQDIYYGLQLGNKESEEFKEVYAETGEDPRTSYGSYASLFDPDAKNDDEEEDLMAARFSRLQQERRQRMEEAAKNSGTDLEDLANEYGVAAPMPVTVYSGDPYAAQFGLEDQTGDEDDFHSAMMKETIDGTQEMNTRIMVDRLNEMNARLLEKEETPAETLPEEEEYNIDETIFEEVPAEEPVEEKPERTVAFETAAVESEPETAHDSFFSRLLHGFHVEEKPKKPESMLVEAEPVPEEEPAALEELTAPAEEIPAVEEAAITAEEPVTETVVQEEPEDVPVHVESNVVHPGKEEEWLQTDEEGNATADVNAWYAARKATEADDISTPEDAAAYRRRMFPEDVSPEEAAAAENNVPAPQETVVHAAPNMTDYAPNNLPMHMFKAEMLQSAVFSEARQYEKPAAETDRGAGSVQKNLRTPAAAVVEEEPEHEYNRPEDAIAISNELLNQMREYTLRTAVSGIAAVVSLLATLLCENTPLLSAGIVPSVGYILFSLVLLAVAAGFNYKTIFNGLSGVHKMQFNADSAVSFAIVGGLLQALSALLFAGSVQNGSLHLYTAVVCAGIALNALGKMVMSRRIYSNFRQISTDDTKYAMKVFDDSGMNARMCHGAVDGQGVPAYTRRTAFLADFMDISYAPDRSEDASATLAPIGVIASLVLAVVSFFLKAGLGGAVCVFAASLCIVTPITNMLAIHLPVSRLSKYARMSGGVVLSSETVEEFGDTNAVMLDASDLFPRGSVELHGLRTFSYKRVDKAIVTAAAVISQVGGPLVSVFAQVLDQMQAQLPEVKVASFENNTGVTAQVNGVPVYIGTRGLLAAHNIYVPGEDFEGQLLKEKRYPVYVAIGTSLAAMLIVSYHGEKSRREELRRMINHGCVIMVSTTDGNITAPMVASTYGLDSKSIRVIPADVGEEFRRRTEEVQPRVSATAATKGRLSSFSRILCSCIEQKALLPVLVALQTAAVCLGFVLLALMVCFIGAGSVTALVLVLYEALWAAIILMYPALRQK